MNAIDRLEDSDVLCLEAYGREYIAVVWKDSNHGTIANLRFGSGRHHTVVNPDLEELLGKKSVEGVNVVGLEGSQEVEA